MARDLLLMNGYDIIDQIIWTKTQASIGRYLLHQHEGCFVGLKKKEKYDQLKEKYLLQVTSNTIFEPATKGSQKPEKIYELIETICPRGDYLELFGRGNNVRPRWLTVGNEDVEKLGL